MKRRRVKTVVDTSEAGQRLDAWLAERFTYHSRNQWRTQIRAELIRVNGETVKPSRLLHNGDEVTYNVDHAPEPPVDLAYRVLHEDQQLMVINKPGNLPCHPAGPYFHNTLWAQLKEKHPYIAVVNRLDRETSGVVLLAKDPETTHQCCDLFAQHLVQKTYLAAVEGVFPASVNATGYLFPAPDALVRKRRAFSHQPVPYAEAADTRFDLVAANDTLSLVSAQPSTGRQHQIRATLHSLGFPMVGDKIYGVDESCYLRFIDNKMTDRDRQRMRMGRQALHAARLAFSHPATGETVVFNAAIPPDMQALLEAQGLEGRALDSATPPKDRD